MIPVCEPLIGEREAELVLDCIRSGWISSAGKYVTQFEEGFARYCGCRYGIATTSGTTALHLAVAALGLGPGDEVILPSFTMIASVLPMIYNGATPVLVDSEAKTWNMDVAQLERKVTPRTKAIMVVHIYGHPVDMDPVLELAKARRIAVIEDAAEAHGAEYKGRKAGSLSDAACFSFFGNKIVTTGEGGMIVTSDEGLCQKARQLRNMAYVKERRFLHYEVGFNYRMTNVQAAIGVGQLERLDELAEMRRRNARWYNELVAEVPGVTLPPEEPWAKNVYWMYSILVNQRQFGMSRDDLMARLEERGIETRPFFVPMHRQPVLLNKGLFRGESYPISDRLSEEGINLPSGPTLTRDQIELVCQTIADLQRQAKAKPAGAKSGR